MLAILVAVVVSLPYVCTTHASIPVIFHPANVYPVLDGLLTVNDVSYVAVVGWVVQWIHPLNSYEILYVLGFQLTYNVTTASPLVISAHSNPWAR